MRELNIQPSTRQRFHLAQWHGGKILLCWMVALTLTWLWRSWTPDVELNWRGHLVFSILPFGAPVAVFVLTWKWFSWKEHH